VPTRRSTPPVTATTGVPAAAKTSLPSWKPVSCRGAPQSSLKRCLPGTGKAKPPLVAIARRRPSGVVGLCGLALPGLPLSLLGAFTWSRAAAVANAIVTVVPFGVPL